MNVLSVALAFLRKDFQEERSYNLNFVLGLGGNLLTLLFLVFASKFVAPRLSGASEEFAVDDILPFWVLGISMHALLGAALQQISGRIRSAQVQGTLEALLATRTSRTVIILCLPLYPLLLTVARALGYVLLAALVFDMQAHWEALPQALTLALLSVVAFMCLGVAMAGLTVAFKRTGPLNNLISGLALFLGGVYYPVSVLPEWLQGPAQLLPITPGLEGLRAALIDGAGWSAITPQILSLLAFIAVFLPCGVFVFRWGLRRAMRDGTLTQY